MTRVRYYGKSGTIKRQLSADEYLLSMADGTRVAARSADFTVLTPATMNTAELRAEMQSKLGVIVDDIGWRYVPDAQMTDADMILALA
jgi:hypothetical protein